MICAPLQNTIIVLTKFDHLSCSWHSLGMHPLHVIVIVTTHCCKQVMQGRQIYCYFNIVCSFHSDACAIKAYWVVEYYSCLWCSQQLQVFKPLDPTLWQYNAQYIVTVTHWPPPLWEWTHGISLCAPMPQRCPLCVAVHCLSQIQNYTVSPGIHASHGHFTLMTAWLYIASHPMLCTLYGLAKQ